MKKIYYAGLIALLPMLANAEGKSIDDNKSPLYVDQTVTVCGKLVAVKSLPKLAYLNIGGKFPKENISFIIWDDQRLEFTQKFGHFSQHENKRLCANGLIKTYKKHLQLNPKSPEALWLE